MTALRVTCAVLLLSGCLLDNASTNIGELDEAFFHCRVESELIESCGFFACHGNPARPFRLYGPNRLRFGVAEEERASALTDFEGDANYAAAEAFARPSEAYSDPLLIAKPLAPSVGGGFHGGVELERFGAVYTTDDAPGLVALRSWIDGSREEPSCVP